MRFSETEPSRQGMTGRGTIGMGEGNCEKGLGNKRLHLEKEGVEKAS